MSHQAGIESPSSGASSPTPRVVDYVLVVSRHGRRTPITECRSLVKKDPEDYGELTAAGREQCRALGRMLAVRYKSLLTGKPGEVLAAHNMHHRTKESVCLTMEGLGVKGVTPIQDATDYGRLYEASLAGHYYLMMKSLCHGEFPTLGMLVDYVCKNAGSASKPQKVAVQVLDSLITHVTNGNPVPDWAQPHWKDIVWADKRLFEMSIAGSEKPLASFVLRQALATLEDKYEKKNLKRADKMYLISTSDVTVLSLIKLLHSSFHERPPFCSSVIIEVFYAREEPRVHVLYCDGLTPVTLTLDKLANPCHLHDFTSELRRLLQNVKTGLPSPVQPPTAQKQ